MSKVTMHKVVGAPFRNVVTLPAVEAHVALHGAAADTRAAIPLSMLPTVRLGDAIRRGAQDHVVIVNEGGLGDQVCAEPTLRRVLREFSCKVSLLSPNHELFTHLPFHEQYTRERQPDWKHVTKFEIMPPEGDLYQDFYVHKEMHAVDFASMRIFRGTIADPADREIRLPELVENGVWAGALGINAVICHPGRTWQSRTLPKEWWDRVIVELLVRHFKPVIIGQDGKETGTVDVDARDCVDLRGKMSLRDLVYLLKHCRFLLSNDSAPIHIAAVGDAFIGMVATVRHPGYLTHWRRGQFGYKTKNFGRDGLWNHRKVWPPEGPTSDITRIPDALMDAILPSPAAVAEEYARERHAMRTTTRDTR